MRPFRIVAFRDHGPVVQDVVRRRAADFAKGLCTRLRGVKLRRGSLERLELYVLLLITEAIAPFRFARLAEADRLVASP